MRRHASNASYRLAHTVGRFEIWYAAHNDDRFLLVDKKAAVIAGRTTAYTLTKTAVLEVNLE